MNGTDNYKLRVLIEESTKSLKFLDHIKTQDDISSQLAGFEISKLLKDQQNNELKYAELVKRRTGLTGIMHKKELEEVEAQIANIAGILKESTKKLCKLFKENPNLQKDSLKVIKERRSLISKLQELMGFIQTNTTQKFQTFITYELYSQDQLRRFMEKEKNLNIDIKKLQQEKNLEFKEYQKEIQENQAKIQEQKEKLMYKTQRAETKKNYSKKEHDAELSNLRRMNEYSEKLLLNELNNLRSKIKIETEVHKQLKEFLISKEEDIKKKSDEWNSKFDTSKDQLDRDIAKLTETKEKTEAQLAEYKEKYEQEEKRKMERELQEKNKAIEKQNKEYQKILIDNAIKLIQEEYQAWKDAGGGKKKKKKK